MALIAFKDLQLFSEDRYYKRFRVLKERFNEDWPLDVKVGLYRELVNDIMPNIHEPKKKHEVSALEQEASRQIRPLLEDRVCDYLCNMSVPQALKMVYELGQKQSKQ